MVFSWTGHDSAHIDVFNATLAGAPDEHMGHACLDIGDAAADAAVALWDSHQCNKSQGSNRQRCGSLDPVAAADERVDTDAEGERRNARSPVRVPDGSSHVITLELGQRQAAKKSVATLRARMRRGSSLSFGGVRHRPATGLLTVGVRFDALTV